MLFRVRETLMMSKQQSEGKSCSSSWNTYQLHTEIGIYEEKSQTNELEKKNNIQNNIKNPIKAGFSLTAHTKFENKTKLQIQKLKKMLKLNLKWIY